jgi:hypothetical protein
MKMIMIAVIVLGIGVFVAATLAHAKTVVVSASIISAMVELKNEQNAEKVQPSLSVTSRGLKELRESLTPILWFGGIAAMIGTAGLIFICARKKQKIV